jgi:predicted nuclease with RNAse H fold
VVRPCDTRAIRKDQHMDVVGIDLAADAKTTGVVFVRSARASRWTATVATTPATDDALVEAVGDMDAVGVDAPLGWPVAFVEAVAAHRRFRPWPGDVDRSTLTHRDTDRAIRRRGIRAALSVSADKLGSVAMRCALLQRRWADEVWGRPAGRDGSGPLVETYPAAALAAWRIDCTGYKNRRDEASARAVRVHVMAELDDALSSWLDIEPVRALSVASDHVLDALVSALVAIAAKTRSTYAPTDSERDAALVEGWIHVPSRPLADLRPDSLTQ